MMSDREKELREALKIEAATVDRAQAHIGSHVEENWELLILVGQIIRSDGPFLPETLAKVRAQFPRFMHGMGETKNYLDMKRRDLQDINHELRNEIRKRKDQEQTA